MAEPKKRNNKSRRGTRRRNIKETLPRVVYCSNCHEANLAHQICKNCGYYRGKLVIEQKEKITENVEEEKAEVKVKKK
jgi:large subunit ribosomal protein L32